MTRLLSCWTNRRRIIVSVFTMDAVISYRGVSTGRRLVTRSVSNSDVDVVMIIYTAKV